MRFRSTVLAVVLLVSAVIPAATNAAAPNAVITWNQYAIEALANPTTAPLPGAGQTPPVTAIHLAMVQGAVYDAVNSIVGDHRPYLQGLPAVPADASQEAAVITAAHDVLVGLVPPLSQVIRDRLDGLRDAGLAAIDDGAANDAGVHAGAAAAAAMLANRANDGRFGSFRFTPSDDVGEWRPTPPLNFGDPFAWVAKVRPFTLKRPSQFRTEGSPSVTSAEYAVAFDEVKSLGSATGSDRSTAQDAMAAFYVEAPSTLWYRTFRTIAYDEDLALAESARLFGMLSFATADAVIGCWDNKAFHSNWRPITAIQLGDSDGNPLTDGQADWTPMLTTPPYPDVASGYNCFTGAVVHTARKFFGTDKFTFTAHSAASNTDRTFTRFTGAVRETIEVRILHGLHFRFADVQGAWLGKKVAQWVDRHAFQPID